MKLNLLLHLTVTMVAANLSSAEPMKISSVSMEIKLNKEKSEIGGKIPATLTIKNTTNDPIGILFNPNITLLMQGVELVVKGKGEILALPGGLVEYPSIEKQYIKIKPGGKQEINLDLSRSIKLTEPGECKISYKSKMVYYYGNEPNEESKTWINGEGSFSLAVVDQK